MFRITRTISLFAAAAALAVPAAAQANGNGAAPAGAAATGKPIPGQYIVTLADDGSDPGTVAAAQGAHVKLQFTHALHGFTATLNQHQLDGLRHNPHVKAIEQDQEVAADNTQILSGGQPWGLDRIDQHTGLNNSYVYGATGAGVRAYVIDTGIQTSHPQFGGRAQDVFDAYGGNGQDCNGHGTHVAGTIGGATYGIAKSVMLRGVRVLDCTGHGSVSGIIAGVDWVRANAIHPAVANISIGGPYSSAENTAVTNLVNSGVFVSVAAGNDGQPACNYSPASAPGTFTTGATDSTDTRASFSNYGGCVDGYAPGVGILSSTINSGTAYMNGTSMASPHVAGVVALGKSAYGDSYTSASWVSWIINNSTVNVVKADPAGTPNRLLFKGTL